MPNTKQGVHANTQSKTVATSNEEDEMGDNLNLFSLGVSPNGEKSVTEQRQRNNSKMQNETRERVPPGTDFTTTYLPSGQ